MFRDEMERDQRRPLPPKETSFRGPGGVDYPSNPEHKSYDKRQTNPYYEGPRR